MTPESHTKPKPSETDGFIADWKTMTHPEQRPEELYLGNTRPEDVWRSSWRTSRLGSNPLMADGTPCPYGGYKPWFIQRHEVQEAIENEKRSNKPWGAERIRVFKEMLAPAAPHTDDPEEKP